MPRRKKTNATESEKQEMVRLYFEGLDCPAIAKLMGYTHHRPVAVALKKLGVVLRDASTRALGKGRTAPVSDTYFSKGICSHRAARVLGLLMTDGNLFNENGAKCKISLVCQHSDEEIVRFLQQELGGHVRSVFDKRTGNHCWHWWALSKQMFDDLVLLGLQPRKSLDIKIDWQRYPKEFHPSILLGIFEGDGSVFLTKRTNGSLRPYASIVSGSQVFIEGLSSMFPGAIVGFTHPKSRKKGWWELRAGSLQSVRIMLSLIYGPHIDESGKLLRKYEMAQQALAYIATRLQLLHDISILEKAGHSMTNIANALGLASYRSVLTLKMSGLQI